MALASDIIRRAYRETNLISIGVTPNANQMSEALESLNTLLLSTIGGEAGTNFEEVVVGGLFDQSDLIGGYVPDDVRIVLNNTEGSIILGLDPYPKEGQRFAVVDTTGTLSLNNVTFDANGRKIEGESSITLDTDNLYRQWMYRADSGNWVRLSEITADDLMPYPTDFDDYFVTMLALRLSPRFSQSINPETQVALQRQRTLLRTRYSRVREVESNFPYGLFNDRYTRGVNFDTGESDSTLYPYLPDRGL